MTTLQELRLLSYRLITLGIVLLGINFSLSGCNTTAGLGRDLQGAGIAIENTAEDTKPKAHR